MESVPLSKTVDQQTVPINALPNELLVFIFIIIRRMPIRWSADVPFAVTASHVSHRWRSIAISTASFWTNIFITSPKDVSRVASYIARSGQRTIDITYYLNRSRDPSSLEIITDLLASHSHRWRRFVIISLVSQPMQTIMKRLSALDAPQLDCLRAIGYLTGYSAGPSVLSQFAASTVSLTALELTHLGDNIRPSYDDFRAFVHSCRSIRSLILDGGSIQEFPSLMMPTEIPTLEALAFKSSGQYYYFFEFLCTPAIETLELCNLDYADWASFSAWMVGTGAPKYSRLRSLILVDIANKNVDISFADACPLLRHIACRGTLSIILELLMGWSYGASEISMPWIHLHTLSISDITARASHIHDIVDCRMKAGVPLRKVRVATNVDELLALPQLEMFEFTRNSHMFYEHVLETPEDEIDWTKEIWKGGIDE